MVGLMATLGGGAGVGCGFGPALGVVVEGGRGGVEGGAGVGEVGGGEGGLDGGALVGPVDVGDALVEGGAGALGRVGEEDGPRTEGEATDAAEDPGATASGRRGDGAQEGAHGGEAVGGGGREGAQDGAMNPSGNLDARGRRRDVGLGDGTTELARVGAREGADAVEGLVEGDGEGELVGAMVGGEAAMLLDGHVGGGAHDHARLGEARRARRGGGSGGGAWSDGEVGFEGEAEVGDVGATVGADEDVVGLEVAVNDARVVGGLKPGGGVAEGGDDLLGAGPLVAGPVTEVGPVDELHGDEDLAAKLTDVVDGDDGGVGELGESLGLAEEAGVALGVAGGVGVEELEGDAAVEGGVVSGEDDAHATRAEGVEDDVAAEDLAALEGGAGVGWRLVPLGDRHLGVCPGGHVRVEVLLGVIHLVRGRSSHERVGLETHREADAGSWVASMSRALARWASTSSRVRKVSYASRTSDKPRARSSSVAWGSSRRVRPK